MFRKTVTWLAFGLMISCAVAWAEKGGIPGKPGGGGETTAVNNLSFPAIMTGDPVSTIPAPVPQGQSSLTGKYFIYDGINPPCDPTVSTCTVSPVYRVYLQKDTLNKWQAYWVANAAATAPVQISHIDVADNLESRPWRTSSTVRVEMVPFAVTTPFKTATNPMQGFEMVYVSGQGTDEVWGAKANTTTPISGYLYDPGWGTVQSTCMGLSLTKLASGPGAIAVAPLPNGYVWDKVGLTWLNTAMTEKIVPFTSEISVKGRMIPGYNWMLQRQSMTPGVSKDGWWRITYFNSCLMSTPMAFTAATQAFDPTATTTVSTSIAVSAAEQYPNYPRVPTIDLANQVVFIDVYIQAGSGSGGGGGGGGKP